MKKFHTTESFIKESISIHGEGTYSYNKTVYVSTHVKVTLFCNTHNEYFEVRPSKHIGKSKQCCQLCSYKKHRSEAKIKDTSYFVAKAKSIHGNLYDYSETSYTVARDKVRILCNRCDNYFYQVASLHLSGSGCSKCNHYSGMDKQRNTTNSFIEAAKVIHNDRYSYSKTIYGKNNMDKVIVTCTTCNVDTVIAPTSLLSGTNPHCKCTPGFGFQSKLPGYVYYLSINNGEAYKIGITNKSVKERYNNTDLQKITVIKEWYFENGEDARAMELGILRKYKTKKSDLNLLSSGNSELFSEDVLGLCS